MTPPSLPRFPLALALAVALSASALAADPGPGPSSPWPDPASFAAPPDRYGVETWWHWINGNVSREGITKDLEAMRAQGIVRATVGAVSMGPEGPVNPILSDLWLDHWRHAVAEADRTGIRLGTDLGPGWSETGGPWIAPENSMKRVVWADRIVDGGGPVAIDLPPLPATLGWSRDIAVLAWPVRRPPSSMAGCAIRSNGQEAGAGELYDGNPATGVESNDPAKWRLEFAFPQPHACDRLHLFVRWKTQGPPGVKLHVVLQADGKPVLDTLVEGRAFFNSLTIPVPETTASRFSLDLAWARPVDPWQTFRAAQVAEAELLHGAEAPQWESELRNLAQESGDAGTAGAPDWTPGPGRTLPAGQIVDLTARVREGRLEWQAPPGQWRVVRVGFTTTGKGSSVPQKGGEGLETDKMSAAAADLHFRSYFQRLIDAIPSGQRRTFDTALLDSWEVGRQNWTADFPAEFARRRGYEITPYLAVLAGEVVGSRDETDRFLDDFRETIGELVTERFFRRNAQLLHERGMRFAVEIAAGDLPFLDVFALAREVDLPMDEFWSDTNGGPPLPPPAGPPRRSVVPEAAFLAGKAVVGAEAFTSWAADYRRTPGDYGYLADHALLWGFNCLQLHSFVHQPADVPPGWTLGRHGQPFNRLNTWWPMIGDWLREIARSQYLSQTSTPVYDVLVYAGDAMPRSYPDLSGLPAGIRLLHIDAAALARLQVRDGRLALADGDRYAALVVPATRLRAETVETIARLLRDGGAVAMGRPGPAPGWSDHAAQDRRIEAAAAAWDSTAAPGAPRIVGKGKLYAPGDAGRMLAETGYRPAFSATAEGDAAPLLVQHRRAGSVELFGLFNPGERAATYACTIPEAGDRAPEIADPLSGSLRPLGGARREGGALSFPLSVEGRRSVYVILSDRTVPAPSVSRAEAASFSIASVFTVTFDGLPGAAPQPWQPPASWTTSADPRIRDYSGIATYRTEFSLPPGFPLGDGVTLDLGRVGRVARVAVNGKPAGTLWRAPWRLDVGPLLKPGANALQVEVANTWLNRLLADAALPPAQRATFTTWSLKGWADTHAAPEESGLLGDITLQTGPNP